MLVNGRGFQTATASRSSAGVNATPSSEGLESFQRQCPAKNSGETL